MTVSNAVKIRTLQTVLYVLTDTGDIFRSTDSAATWTAVSTLSQVGMRGMVKNGADLAVASREGHVAVSGDGTSWTWQGSMNQLTLTALASNEPVHTGVGPGTEPPVVVMSPPYPNPSAQGVATLALELTRSTEVSLRCSTLRGEWPP